MNPLRLLILFILLYILYRLLTNGKRRTESKRQSTEGTAQIRDVLMEDPVCHTYIPKGQAVTAKKDGATYYFCSAKCRETFMSQKGGSE
jgi:YHS domain-containing protein